MLEQSLWNCLFLWLLKFHFFVGVNCNWFWCSSSTGHCICASGIQDENKDQLLDSDLHLLSYTGWISDNHRHWSFSPFTVVNFCPRTNESDLKNPTVAVKEDQEILIIPEFQNTLKEQVMNCNWKTAVDPPQRKALYSECPSESVRNDEETLLGNEVVQNYWLVTTGCSRGGGFVDL